jgi:hypothetical protein
MIIKKTNLLLLLLSIAAPVYGQAGYFGPGGTYTGLFYEPDGYWQQSAGIITITTTTTGRYTGKLRVGTENYSFSGQFNPDGTASRGIRRVNRNDLIVRMAITEDPDLIHGTVMDGIWTSDLFADRLIYNGKTSVCPDAGQYTMLIPGDFTSTTEPAGDSFATITVDPKGKVRCAASLADGTKFSQSSTVSKVGLWPLYASLYQGGGAIYSWMLFNGSVDEQLTGDAVWIKSEMSTGYYPDGFAITISGWGSRYYKPLKGQNVLDLTEAAVEFNGGNLYESFTNHVSIDSNNRVFNFSPNAFSLKFSPGNGTFTGKVQDPSTGYYLPFRGVALQNYGVAAGFFSDSTRTGEIWMEPW